MVLGKISNGDLEFTSFTPVGNTGARHPMVKPVMKTQPAASKTLKQTLLDRLARLDGQAQALRRMVGQSDDWKKMLTLAAAIEGAADQVTADLFRGYLDSLTDGGSIGAKAREGLELVLKRR